MSTMPLRAPGRVRVVDPSPATTAPLPRLRIVRAPAQSRTRLPFLVLCVAILASALLGALLLNVTMAQTSYAIRDRQVELARLQERQQNLAQHLEVAASPSTLADRATALGMVPAPAPAFLRLSDGAIIGESEPAGAAG